MKRTLNIINVDSGAIGVLTPSPGKEVRLAAVTFGGVGMLNFEQVTVRYERSGDIIAIAASNPVSDAAIFFSGNVESSHTAIIPTIIDPVTGALEFGADQTTVHFPLPDIWWPWQIEIRVQTGSLTTNICLLYEERDI